MDASQGGRAQPMNDTPRPFSLLVSASAALRLRSRSRFLAPTPTSYPPRGEPAARGMNVAAAQTFHPCDNRNEGISVWRYATIACHKGRWHVGTRPWDDVCDDPVTIPIPSEGSSWVHKLLQYQQHF